MDRVQIMQSSCPYLSLIPSEYHSTERFFIRSTMVGLGHWKNAYKLPSMVRLATVDAEAIKKEGAGFIF